MPFAVLVIWRAGSSYRLLLLFNKNKWPKLKYTIVYPNIPSTLRPGKHDDSLPIPKPSQQ
jgi:hypothetical protein